MGGCVHRCMCIHECTKSNGCWLKCIQTVFLWSTLHSIRPEEVKCSCDNDYSVCAIAVCSSSDGHVSSELRNHVRTYIRMYYNIRMLRLHSESVQICRCLWQMQDSHFLVVSAYIRTYVYIDL